MRRHRFEAFATARSACIKVLIALGVLLALGTWVFGVYRVTGNAMKPTAGDGDLALTYRVFGGLEADDVVVYRVGQTEAMGRVVAQPGDTVEVTSDGVFKVNGAAQPSLTGASTPQSGDALSYPLTLGEGQYFVLADARGNATDSRELGVIGNNEVEGKVVALLRLRQI